MLLHWTRVLVVPHTGVACQLRQKKKLTSPCIVSWRQTPMSVRPITKLTVMRLIMVLIIGLAREIRGRPLTIVKNSSTAYQDQWVTQVTKRLQIITRNQMVFTCPELRSLPTRRASFNVCEPWMISTLIRFSALSTLRKIVIRFSKLVRRPAQVAAFSSLVMIDGLSLKLWLQMN